MTTTVELTTITCPGWCEVAHDSGSDCDYHETRPITITTDETPGLGGLTYRDGKGASVRITQFESTGEFGGWLPAFIEMHSAGNLGLAEVTALTSAEARELARALMIGADRLDAIGAGR